MFIEASIPGKKHVLHAPLDKRKQSLVQILDKPSIRTSDGYRYQLHYIYPAISIAEVLNELSEEKPGSETFIWKYDDYLNSMIWCFGFFLLRFVFATFSIDQCSLWNLGMILDVKKHSENANIHHA